MATIEDFGDWRMLVRPAIAVYTPQTGGGANYYPGRYVGQTVTGPDGIVYDFAGVDQQIFDMLWVTSNPAGVIVGVGDWFINATLTPPAYATQVLKPGGFGSLTPPVFIRTTIADWFVGVAGGSTGDDAEGTLTGAGLRTSVGADGLGAYYTLFPDDYDPFLNWSGVDVGFQAIVLWTGQYFVALAPCESHSAAYHNVRVYRSPDAEGLAFNFVTEIEPGLIPDNWLTYTIGVTNAFATRGGTPGGTDQIMFYDESVPRVEIPFPPDDQIELLTVTLVRRPFSTIYTQGTDYTVNIPARTISWAPAGLEPPAGSDLVVGGLTRSGYANWPYAAVSPLNGVIYALLVPQPINVGDTKTVQVVVSHDHGTTWAATGSIETAVNHGGLQSPSLAWLDGGVNGPSGGVLIAGLLDGIWRSEDGGFTWSRVVVPFSGLQTQFGQPIEVTDAAYAPKILALSGTDAVMTITDVEVSADPYGIVWSAGRILKTTDGGLSWTMVYLQDQPSIGQLVPNASTSPDVLVRLNDVELIAMSQFGNIFYSGDAGDTWSVVQPYTTGLIDTFTFQNGQQGTTIDGNHALFVTSPNGGIYVNVPRATLCGNTVDRRVRRGRTVAVAEIEYAYPWEANVEDFGARGARELIFEVQARTFVQGKQQLGEISRLHVSNPAPDMTGIIPATIALPGALFVDWSSYITPDLDMDHFEVRYGFVNNVLALTSTIRRDKDQNNVIIPNLVQSLTVYLMIVPFDKFGEGLPSEIVHDVPLATISLSA